MIAFHRGQGLPFTLGVFRVANPRECGIAEVRKEGVVTGIVENSEKPSSELAGDVYIIERRIFKFFPNISLKSPLSHSSWISYNPTIGREYERLFYKRFFYGYWNF